MQIIVVHEKFSQAHSIRLKTKHLVILGVLGAMLTAATSGAIAWFMFKGAQDGDMPLLSRVVSGSSEGASAAPSPGASASEQRYVRENLDALATKLGEIQARLTRLDAIGERVSNMMGVKAPEPASSNPGRGGPLQTMQVPPSLPDLQSTLDQIEREVDARADTLSVLEIELLERTAKSRLFPSKTPIQAGFTGSGFGTRVDPFTGRRAMHEGVDFAAPHGSPILAAAGGIVADVQRHHDYGNYVDVTHANGIVTRYAHCSQIFVKPGQIVKAGQHIAAVGSTGRSTGSHLHFEVRIGGAPQNPMQFLLAREIPKKRK